MSSRSFSGYCIFNVAARAAKCSTIGATNEGSTPVHRYTEFARKSRLRVNNNDPSPKRGDAFAGSRCRRAKINCRSPSKLRGILASPRSIDS